MLILQRKEDDFGGKKYQIVREEDFVIDRKDNITGDEEDNVSDWKSLQRN